MPKIIKVTRANGQPQFVNVDHIVSFTGIAGTKVSTKITLSTAENIDVLELIPEILAQIEN